MKIESADTEPHPDPPRRQRPRGAGADPLPGGDDPLSRLGPTPDPHDPHAESPGPALNATACPAPSSPPPRKPPCK